MSVEDLLAWVAAGRVRIPAFQRGLVWQADDIKLLFDSIYRGYPIGTLLFWKKHAEAAVVKIGPVRLSVPHREDALWVVDGQQRITALVGVLTGEYEDSSADHTLYFDLAAEELVRASKRRPPEPSWLPLNRVVDSEALLAWLLERPELGALQSVAIRLGKRVREYQMPAYIVETEDETLLREIFHRTNRGGKPLSEDQVFEALHGARQEEPAGLAAISEQLLSMGFGRIEQKYVYLVLLALIGKDLSRGSQLRLDRGEARAALPRAQAALSRAIAFLQGRARIPHVDLLPYKRPLIMLARFFDLHPDPHPRSLVLLSRWIWRGAITEQHQGNTVTTRKALNAIGPDEVSSIDMLLREVGRERPETLDLSQYNFRHARSKLHTLSLLALGPRHIVTGDRLALDDLLSGGSHSTGSDPRTSPVQPISAWKSVASARSRGLAGLLLHPALPGGLRQPLVAQTDHAALRSHAITPEAHEALRGGDHETFLALRDASLHEHISRFLEARAEWDASDRPPIAALLMEDEP